MALLTDPLPERILIAPSALAKLKGYIALSPMEVSGLGRMEVSQEGPIITDVFLLPQTSSWSETELDPEALLAFLEQLVAEGQDPAAFTVWWHSHGDLELEWSEVDEATIETFGSEALVSVVGNRRGEFRCRLDLFQPERKVLDSLPLVPLGASESEDLELRALIETELKVKVKTVEKAATPDESNTL
ncbi:MAG: hypothetical protein HY347_09255 [candidate division NC10 bacterium]|nr:hypothetical protein [candidate division NC10 bacterium]